MSAESNLYKAMPCPYCMCETWHSSKGICTGIHSAYTPLRCTTCGHMQAFSAKPNTKFTCDHEGIPNGLVAIEPGPIKGICDQCGVVREWVDGRGE